MVPPVIYSIPPSSPLHYVTYVQVYDVTPQYVVVGYTPGYFGTVVGAGGVVVYGTGYVYAPYIGATVWYPPPVTYGYGGGRRLDALDGLGRRLRLRPRVRRRGRRDLALLGLLPRALLGGHALRPLRRGRLWPVWRRGGVGAARLGGDIGQRVPALGIEGAVTRTSGGYNAWTGNAWSSQVGHSYNS